MIKYYTLITTRKSETFDDETVVQSFENYELFKSYALNNAGNSNVSKQRLLKTELGYGGSVPMEDILNG